MSIPISGLLIALFTIERLVNGWRHGFAGDEEELLRTYAEEGCRRVSEWTIVGLMAFLFVLFGVLGVPVPFAVIASVMIGVLLTDISLATVVAEMFNGINAVPLLAVPFFILLGEIMASSNVTERLVRFAQALVGHIRGGLAQVVTVVSMFFAGISGSSTADVAAIGQVMLPPMKRGVQPANSAALVAAASTIANMIPPSIMAIVYGAVGGVSIVALFVGGVVPGVMVGIGLMIYSYFTFSQTVRERSSFGDVARRRSWRGATVDTVHHHRRHPGRVLHPDGGGHGGGRLHDRRRHPAARAGAPAQASRIS